VEAHCNANEMTMDKRGGAQAEASTFDEVARIASPARNQREPGGDALANRRRPWRAEAQGFAA
jgi:hypothetical protein